MAYIPVYSSRINWENEPSIVSPINATNLNKMDYALKAHDDTLANWDITKANESDLLLALKNVSYDTDTGEFVFTWFNGNTTTVDLNIEKIPVSFSMDANGVITMTTEDGTQYTADVGALIKTYTFTDSSEINFSVTTDADGNKTVTASIVAGSIDGTKLVPNYLADCVAAKTDAETAEGKAENSAEDAEAWAVGTRGGVPVPSTDPAYENNAEWWATHTSSSFAGLTDTDITNPQNGQVPVYNSTTNKWENQNQSAGGGSTVVVTTSESSLYGQSVTLSDGVTTLTETFSGSGEATFSGVTLTGNVTVSASAGAQTASKTLSIPYFGNYSTVLSFFTATITVTFDASKGATCTLDGVTASTSPYTFTVNSAGTYTASCTLDGVTKQGAAKVITTDGQAETDTIEFGTINVTYTNDFRGLSITCVNGGTTITKTAPSGSNSMVFYPPTTGTWVVSGTVGGTPYPKNAVVSSLSTPVSINLETIPNGSTATPTDDVETWLKCAGITDKAYTTLSQVIGDSETFNALLGDSNACAYMARSTTFASTLCADQYAMNLLGQYDTACDALLSDSTWASAIANSTYWQSVLGYSNPVMTNNTTPEGVASCTNDNTNAYKAFDGNDTTFVVIGGSNISSIQYQFANSVKIAKTRVRFYNETGATTTVTANVRVSNDGSTWSDVLGTGTTSSFASGSYGETVFDFPIDETYLYYKAECIDQNLNNVRVATLQFYGRIPSSEKIHGGNPASGETFYYTDGGTDTPIADPSLLSAGTYTIYSNGLAKATDLTSDYGKTVRICPNTKEIVVRPDKTLYWWGYENPNLEDMTASNGWSYSGYSFVQGTHNNQDITLTGTTATQMSGVGSKLTADVSKVSAIAQGITILSGAYAFLGIEGTKTFSNEVALDLVDSSSVALFEASASGNYYLGIYTSKQRSCKLSALWCE